MCSCMQITSLGSCLVPGESACITSFGAYCGILLGVSLCRWHFTNKTYCAQKRCNTLVRLCGLRSPLSFGLHVETSVHVHRYLARLCAKNGARSAWLPPKRISVDEGHNSSIVLQKDGASNALGGSANTRLYCFSTNCDCHVVIGLVLPIKFFNNYN